jgi:hypothetical protein
MRTDNVSDVTFSALETSPRRLTPLTRRLRGRYAQSKLTFWTCLVLFNVLNKTVLQLAEAGQKCLTRTEWPMALTSILQDLIPEIITNQKQHMRTISSVNGFGATI